MLDTTLVWQETSARASPCQIAEEPHDYYVIELSSFQLDDMYDFRANIAILLNITPDHLDRYDNQFEKYADSKMRIIRTNTRRLLYLLERRPCHQERVGEVRRKGSAVPILRTQGEGQYRLHRRRAVHPRTATPFNMEQEDLSLTGKHNIYNSLAAGLTSNISGIKKESIRKSLSDFPGVEHRLEKVCKVAGCSIHQRLEGYET